MYDDKMMFPSVSRLRKVLHTPFIKYNQATQFMHNVETIFSLGTGTPSQTALAASFD